MSAIELLAEAARQVPELADLHWMVTEHAAAADLFALAHMHTERLPGAKGDTLVVTPAPDALPWVLLLHEAGWKRGGYAEQWGWELHATLERDGASLTVTGPTHTPPAHGNDAIPYFAPPPPELPRRTSPGFIARYREWERKCFAKEW